MEFREFINKLKQEGRLISVTKPVSKTLEISGLLKALDGQPVLLEQVNESKFKVIGNLCASKQLVADYFDIKPEEYIDKMLHAIENPSQPEKVEQGPCQEVEIDEVDLDTLPILFHCDKDGGNYISSGVIVAKDPDYGQNLDFHRLMQIGKNKFSVRVVSSRHFDYFLKRQKKMPVAVCIGNGMNVLLAAATSVALGQDELEIANTLAPLKVVRAKTFDAWIPADCEFVLEGTIDLEERAEEGPFVDLTETYDTIRQEPVFTVTKITHRQDAIWQALLPGALEHKALMGMPREPTIFRQVLKTGVNCRDVHINPGGCSWLHAIVQIDKKTKGDGIKVLKAAFRGHSSLKHCFVVDKDINIYDPLNVEWAMATRFQGGKDLLVIGKEPGSSLDPSGEKTTKMTYKIGFDLTKPFLEKDEAFKKAAFPQVNINDYLGD